MTLKEKLLNTKVFIDNAQLDSYISIITKQTTSSKYTEKHHIIQRDYFKINKQNAYKILQTVGVKQEQLDRVYKKLISPNIFYDLLNKGKIKADDDSIVVKYDIYRL